MSDMDIKFAVITKGQAIYFDDVDTFVKIKTEEDQEAELWMLNGRPGDTGRVR